MIFNRSRAMTLAALVASSGIAMAAANPLSQMLEGFGYPTPTAYRPGTSRRISHAANGSTRTGAAAIQRAARKRRHQARHKHHLRRRS